MAKQHPSIKRSSGFGRTETGYGRSGTHHMPQDKRTPFRGGDGYHGPVGGDRPHHVGKDTPHSDRYGGGRGGNRV